MNSSVDGAKIRRVLLEVLKEFDHPQLQSLSVLGAAAQRLGFERDLEMQKVLLTLWHDLYRSGHISWGYSIHEPNLPWCHLTESGRKALEHLSRDPVNPDGYLANLRSKVQLNPISQSYVEEALRSYNSNCFKAAAVMVGCASELILLELRDTLIDRIKTIGATVPKDLQDWKVKRILDSFKGEIDKRAKSMPIALREAYESYWLAFTQQIRVVRNDAGHPISVDPITPETVQAALLIFPELADLSARLREWISKSYS